MEWSTGPPYSPSALHQGPNRRRKKSKIAHCTSLGLNFGRNPAIFEGQHIHFPLPSPYICHNTYMPI
ncbi:hypothetical protein FKM82_007540 [Ascaphus truei]